VERFAAKPQPEAPAGGDSAFEVSCRRSGVTVTIPPGKSIIEVLEENGVSVLSSCLEGVCGTCETPVLSGIPDHRDSLLTQEEREANEYIRQYTPVNLQEILDASRQSASGQGEPRSVGWRGLVSRAPNLRGREFASFTAVPLALRASQAFPIGGDRQNRRFVVQGNSAGGFSYRCLPPQRVPQVRAEEAEVTDVRESCGAGLERRP
jgi:ferredoxin